MRGRGARRGDNTTIATGIFHEADGMGRGARPQAVPTNERSSEYPPERSGMTAQPSLGARRPH
jgi:hypothetical protein